MDTLKGENIKTDYTTNKTVKSLDKNEIPVSTTINQINGCRRYEIVRNAEHIPIAGNTPYDTLIILDTSSSMLQPETMMVSKIVPNIKDLAQSIILKNPKNKIGILTFGGYNGTIEDDTNYVVPFTSNLAGLNSILDDIKIGETPYFVGGDTDIDAALAKATQILETAKTNGVKDNNMNVFIFTDGGGNLDLNGNYTPYEVLTSTINTAKSMKKVMPNANYFGLSMLQPSDEGNELYFTQELFNSYIPVDNQIIVYKLNISYDEIKSSFDKVTEGLLREAAITFIEKFTSDAVNNFKLGTFRDKNGFIYDAVKVNDKMVPVFGISGNAEVSPVDGITVSIQNGNELYVTVKKDSADLSIENILTYQIYVKDDIVYPDGANNIGITNSSQLEVILDINEPTNIFTQGLSNIVLEHINEPLKVNAGADREVNSDQTITLGGNPTASGGSGNYAYEWSTVNNQTDFIPKDQKTESNPVINLGSLDLGDKKAFEFKVQVKDKNDCVRSSNVILTLKQPTEPPIIGNLIKSADKESIPKEVGQQITWKVDIQIPTIKIGASVIEIKDIINSNLKITAKKLTQGTVDIFYVDNTLGNSMDLQITDSEEIQKLSGQKLTLEVYTEIESITSLEDKTYIENTASLTIFYKSSQEDYSSNVKKVNFIEIAKPYYTTLTINVTDLDTKKPMENVKLNLFSVTDKGIKTMIDQVKTGSGGTVELNLKITGNYCIEEQTVAGYKPLGVSIYFKIEKNSSDDSNNFIIVPIQSIIEGKYEFSNDNTQLDIQNEKAKLESQSSCNCNKDIYNCNCACNLNCSNCCTDYYNCNIDSYSYCSCCDNCCDECDNCHN